MVRILLVFSTLYDISGHYSNCSKLLYNEKFPYYGVMAPICITHTLLCVKI